MNRQINPILAYEQIFFCFQVYVVTDIPSIEDTLPNQLFRSLNCRKQATVHVRL